MLYELVILNLLSDVGGSGTFVFSGNLLFPIGNIDPSDSISFEGVSLFRLPDLDEALDCL